MRKLRTPLTELVGIEHPVVQTGMGWVAGARLVAATSNAGGLGILASATMTLDELAIAIGKVKAATDKPFGVNIRADAGDAGDRVELMIREGVKVASFALAPKPELISKLKEAGSVVIPSVGLAKHARKVASWGADAVIVQGGEGGGHTGPIATTLLLPSVLDAVSIPVIAAGGFFDGRGLAAALSYGAAGVAMGTRFLLTSDSTVPDAVKQRYLQSALDGTVVTTRVDGMPHRVLRTGLVEKLESGSRARGFTAAVRNAGKFKKMSQMTWASMIRDGLAMRHGKQLSWSQVVMAANTPMLLKAGLVEGNTDAGVLASGQVAGIVEDLPSCAELIDAIVADAVKHLQAATAYIESLGLHDHQCVTGRVAEPEQRRNRFARSRYFRVDVHAELFHLRVGGVDVVGGQRDTRVGRRHRSGIRRRRGQRDPGAALGQIHLDPAIAAVKRCIGSLLEAQRLVERNRLVLLDCRHAHEAHRRQAGHHRAPSA